MKKINALANLLSNALFYVALAAGALMMLHVTVDVASRTFLNYPLPGTGEITATYYMIALTFLPLAWVTLRDEHVTADIFIGSLPGPLRHVIAVLVDVLVIIYVSAFVWQSTLSALARTRRGEVWEIIGGYLPVWPTRWFLPVAGGAMALVMIFRLLARLTGHKIETGEDK